MDVITFLKGHHPEITEIINGLSPIEFSSHDFIEKFARMFEREYIEMLYDYRTTGNAFKTVHSAIAKYLSQNMASFNIVKNPKGPSEHVFGNIDVIQWWRRI
jgi:hypothetical protein